MHVEQLPHDELVAVAQGLVKNEYMIVDPDDRDWQASMALMWNSLAEYDNIGYVLVPLADHSHTRWLNNRVPALTMKIQLIASEDVDELIALATEMVHVLYPEIG